ncbi:hypothetical protein D3C75_1002350 [compost metagenome]
MVIKQILPLALELLEAFGHTHAEIAVSGMRVQLAERHFVRDNHFAHLVNEIDDVGCRQAFVPDHGMGRVSFVGIANLAAFRLPFQRIGIVDGFKWSCNSQGWRITRGGQPLVQLIVQLQESH